MKQMNMHAIFFLLLHFASGQTSVELLPTGTTRVQCEQIAQQLNAAQPNRNVYYTCEGSGI